MEIIDEESLDLLSLIKLSVFALIVSRIYLKSIESFRRWRVKPHITEEMRNTYGAYSNLFIYFYLNDHEEFYSLTRMTIEQFDQLHALVKPKLARKTFRGRKPLASELRLAATLQFVF